jgi:mannonate dehydratase
MRVAIGQFNQLSHERLMFAKQLGASGVLLNTPVLPGEKRWEVEDLRRLRTHVEEYGLRLEALENTPISFYDQAMLGLPGRDEQIEHYQATIRNMGKAGIPILGYHWMPNRVWRTSRTTPGRGGAHVTSFDLDLAKDAPLTHGRVFTEDEMWQNYEYFIKAVVPVAEAAGVKLALHPDDPPWPIFGLPRIITDAAALERLVGLVDSPANGVTFCTGSLGALPGNDLPAMVRRLGAMGRIHFAHCRNVLVTGERAFQETPHPSACGGVDIWEVLRALRDTGFSGPMRPDHGRMIWGETGRPGYGLYDRALGGMYLYGLWEGLTR